MLSKEGVELGKDLLKENKNNIQKIVSKQSQNILKKLLNKVSKQDVSNIKNDFVDLTKENRDSVRKKQRNT